MVLKCFILCRQPSSVGGVFRLSVPFVGRIEIVGILGEKHVKMKNRGINKTMFTNEVLATSTNGEYLYPPNALQQLQ